MRVSGWDWCCLELLLLPSLLSRRRLSVPVVYLCICIGHSSNINLTVLELCTLSVV